MLGLKNLENIKTNVDVVSSLADKPDISATALKNTFDTAAKELKNDINATIDDLNGKLEVLNALLSADEVEQKINDKLVAVGAGDMAKSVYDTDGDGIVDNSRKIDGMTVQDILFLQNPVGTIKITTVNINPGAYIGGTWVAWGQGRVPVGLGQANQNTLASFGTLTDQELAIEFITPEATSGTYYHKLKQSEIPAHAHESYHAGNKDGTDWVGESGTSTKNKSYTTETGGGEAHNNMPPYITCYMWKRVA